MKAYVFDAYGTLFDVHSVMQKIEEKFPQKSDTISKEWRTRQVKYFMIRQLIDGYLPFDQLTKGALIDALEASEVAYEDKDIEDLMEAYQHLQPYEEVATVTDQLQDKALTIFSNGTEGMLQPLLKNNQLENKFSLLSADDAKVYKPRPEAYQYAQNKLEIENKSDILFMSSNPWDIAGAASYGFQTAWINRQGVKWPELGIKPTYTFKDLHGIINL
ncbi:haloacid dehalogenase type II [Thalassobacillus hwangdonensis]|uniref:Haloacid dehalogenase type II n=1 Tax=Thalassobacillus hwangdonensis TaxID=546108 RepID=A0ABW3L3I3_9BACI